MSGDLHSTTVSQTNPVPSTPPSFSHSMHPKKNLLRLSQNPAMAPALTVSIAPPPNAAASSSSSSKVSSNQQQNQQEEEEEEEDGDSTADCMAKLKVPTPLLVADNTPTPVRNLLAENPFDEHFRKAAQEAVRGESAAVIGKDSREAEEETLNTPQIESLLEAEQSALPHHSKDIFVTNSSAIQPPPPTNRPYFRPIAAAPTQQLDKNTSSIVLGGEPSPSGSSGVVTHRAKLLLQIPNAKEPLHLSDIPVQTRLEPPPQAEKTPGPMNAPMVAPPPRRRQQQDLSADDDGKKAELLERNRAAAFRSRQKRKKMAEQTDMRVKQLEASNSNLSTENNLLRAEVVKLKALLAEHRDCEVTRRQSGEEERIRRETQPKAVTYKGQQPMTQVRVVTVNPQDAAQRAGVAQSAQVELALVGREERAAESIDILSLATQELHRSVSADLKGKSDKDPLASENLDSDGSKQIAKMAKKDRATSKRKR